MRAAENAACYVGGDESLPSPGSGNRSVDGGGVGGAAEGGGRGTTQPFRPFQGFLSFGRWGEDGNVSGLACLLVCAAMLCCFRWRWLLVVFACFW